MLTSDGIKRELGKAFNVKQAAVLSKVIVEAHDDIVRADDFNELKDIVKELGIKVSELAEAQKGSEKRLTRLEAAVEKLAEAQKKSETRLTRVEDELTLFRRTFTSEIGGLGARWGVRTESSFRNAIEGILSEVGFKTERFNVKDEEGIVFGHPEMVEMDVVIQDSKIFLIEIKSSINKGDVYLFDKKVKFYQKYAQQTPYRRIILSPYIESSAMKVAISLGMEVFTDINEIK